MRQALLVNHQAVEEETSNFRKKPHRFGVASLISNK